MLRLLGTLVTTRSRAVLALGIVVLGLAGWLAVGAFGKLQAEGFDDPSSESTRAAERLEEVAGGGADYLFVVTAETGTVDDGPAAEAGRELTRRLQADPGFTEVTSYFDGGGVALRSDDGEHALVTAGVAADAAPEPGDVIDEHTVDSDDVTVRVGGGEAVGEEIGSQIGADLALAEAIAMPLILALLVLAFGNGVAALVTLAVGTFSIVGTFAELSVLGSLTDVSIYAVNLTTGLGLGLAVDYGLLMVARVREERAAGREHRAAVVRAVETAGRTIVFSATTVAVALAAMLVFPLYFLRSFAYAGIGVMVITALSAVVLLPAALTLLGDRVDSWKVPGVRGIRGGAAPFWGRLAGLVVRRPVLTAVPVLGVLALMALPLLGVSFGTPDDRVLPTSAGSRQVGDVLREELTGDRTSPITVVTSGPVPEQELAAYAERVAALPGVVRAEPRPGDDGAVVHVVTDLDSRSAAARDLVAEIRELPDPPGVEALVGGRTAELVDSTAAIIGSLPLAAGWLVVTTVVILFLFTGSVVQPLRALLLNAAGLAATLGAMVWVFQDGHLSGQLGFTPMPLDISMMVLLFCVAFGLSMDYEVFVMGRITEMREHGLPSEEAVVRGLAHTGRIVSTAAALIAISFFAFLVSRVSFIQFFGLGTGLAILVDATLIRGVLLPAGIRLLGEAAWWAPRPLRAVADRFRLREGSEDAPAPSAVPVA